MKSLYEITGRIADVNTVRVPRQEFEALPQAARQAVAVEQEPVGFMNAGHLCELENRRIPYGYVYPSQGTGADVPLYAAPQPARKLPAEGDEVYNAIKGVDRLDALAVWRAAERFYGIGGEV